MAATIVNAEHSALKTFTDNGDGTGFLNVGGTGSASSNTSTGTATSVAASASSVQLLAANTARKSASIFNDADKALYVKFGTTASTSSFKVKIAAGGYWDFPMPIYTGRVDGIWDTAPTGNARISEET